MSIVNPTTRVARLRTAWQSGLCLPLVSTATARELVRVLAYPKFRLTVDEQQELLADYLPRIGDAHGRDWHGYAETLPCQMRGDYW